MNTRVTGLRSRWERFVSLTLAALVVFAAPIAASEDEPSEAERLMQLLRDATEAEQIDPPQLMRSLSEFSPDVIPILFAVLDTGIIPSGETATLLAEDIRGAVWGAFAAYPPVAIRAHVAKFADAKYKERTRLNALKLLGGVGDVDDLVLIGQLAAPTGSSPTDSVRVPFGYAIAKIFERDPGAVMRVRRLYQNCHASLRPKLLERISRANTTEKLAVLSGLLSLAPESDSYVLRSIGDLASSGRGTTDEYVCGNVRAFLFSHDHFLVQAAAQTLGALRDEGAIEQLIGLLREDNPRTKPVALNALVSITAHNFGANAEAWQIWYDEEKRWWRNEASRVFDDLRQPNPGRVAAAIQLVSMHSLYREELATALLTVLDRDEPSLRRMACITLGNLGAEGARAGLQELLDDPDEDVRAAAKAAVSRLTFRIIPRH